MGILIDANKKRRQEDKEKKSSSPSSSQGISLSKYAAQRKMAQTVGLDTFETDLTSLSKTIDSVYSGWQTKETMDNTRLSVQKMYNRLGKYQEYQKKYGGTDLSEVLTSYKSILDGWEDLSNMYGNYKTADAFNVAKKNAQLSKQFEGLSYEDVQKKLGEYEADSEEYNFLKSYTQYTDLREFDKAIESMTDKNSDYYKSLKKAREAYKLDNAFDLHKDVMQNEDFAEKSKYVSTKAEGFWGNLSSDYGLGYEDATYEYINNKVDGIRSDILDKQRIVNKDSITPKESMSDKGYDELLPEEVAVYNYWYDYDKKHGTKKAQEFLDAMEVTLQKRVYDKDTERLNKSVDKGVASSAVISALTVPANMFGGYYGILDTVTDVIKGKEYNPYSLYKSGSNLANDAIGYVSENIAEATEGFELLGKNIPSFLYQTGMAVLDSKTGGTFLGKAHTALMGTNAYMQKAKELTEEGVDGTIVQANALVTGALEAVFEYAGFEHLMKLKNPDDMFKVVTNALKSQGVTEGLEELGTSAGNIIADISFRGKDSEYIKKYNDMIARGYTKKEATSETALAIIGELGWSYAGGFLSGMTLGGTQSYNEYSVNKHVGQNIKANERVGEVFDIASNPEVASAYETYTRYANKGINADNITDAQLGSLYTSARADAQATLDSKKSTQEQKDSAQKIKDDLDVYGQYNRSARINKKVSKDLKNDTESVVQMIESGLESGENTDSYRLAAEYKGKIANYDKLAEVVAKKMNGEDLTTEETKMLAESKVKLSTNEISKLVEANEKAFKDEEIKNVATRLVEEGESAELADIVTRKLRGETITTEEAEKVMDSDVAQMVIAENSNAENVTDELIAKAKTMDKEKGALFISLYDGETDIEAYANAFNLVTTKAENNFTFDNILQHKNVLSGEQISKIYSEVRIKADQKQTMEIQKLAEKTANLKAYKAVIDESAIDYNNTSAEGKVNWNDLTSRQKKAVTFIKGFAQATGMNLTFVANNPEYNGKYEKSTNTIYINLDEGGFDAITHVRESLIPTMSHELTHWMEMKSPVLYRRMNEIVFSTLQRFDGLTEDERIAKEISKAAAKEYKKQYEKENPGKKISLEKALKMVPKDVLDKALADSKRIEIARSEIIARACEDMLSMSEQGKKMFYSFSESEQKTLKEKILDLIQNLKDWVSEFLGLYKSGSYEAKIMRAYEEDLNELLKIWDAMLVDSVKVNQALEKSGAYGHKNSAERDMLYQAKEIDSKGNPYWQIETDKDIFKGIDNVKGLQSAAYNYILNGDKGNRITDLIDGKKLEFIRVSAKEYVYGEASKTLSTEEYKQKMRMSTSIIDLIENATIEYDAPDHKSHKLFPDGFKNYQGRVGIDETIFRYIVRVGKAKNGMIFYDINLEVDGKVPRANRTSLIKSSTSNKSISNSDKNVKELFSDKEDDVETQINTSMTSERDYSYDELIGRDDLEGFVINKTKQVKLSKDGKIDAPWVVNEVKKKCKVLKTNSNTNAYYTEVPDIDRNVEISYKGITHGFMKSLLKKTKVSSDRDILNARVSLEIPQLLRNSIEVNRSSREGNLDIPYAHIMIGTVGLEDAKGDVEYYAVRSVIEERVNQNPILAEAEVLGKLHGINAKKIGTPHARVTNNGVALTSSDAYTYNVAQFLEDVKTEFDDTFSEDVYKNLSMTRKVNNFSEDLLYSDKDYSYEKLISKPDMKLTVLSGNVPNNRADIVYEAKKNAAKVGTINTKDKTVSVFVDDVGRDIVLNSDGLRHGMARGKNIQSRPIAIVTLKAGEIIKNSIRINELNPSKESATGSYILIGAAIDNNGNLYLVRSVINEYGDELASMDVLYAINTKKESAMLNASRYAKNSLSVTDSTISIAELLGYVNKYFPDILPESVLRHYGYDARPESKTNDKLGESVLFSEKETTSVYDLMGENDRLKKENEQFKADVERLKERLKIERKITHGNYFNENQLGAVAGHLRNISKSHIDKVKLVKNLKDVYSFIAQAPNLTWDEVFEKCYRVAYAMLEESKPITMTDEYTKSILSDIRNTKISLSETQKQEAKYIFGKHWNRNFLGRATIVNKGIPLESQWQEWAELYPHLFDTDVSEGNMPEKLYDILNDLQDAAEIEMEYDEEEQIRWLAREIYNQYWNVSPIRTTAEKYDKQIKLLNFEHRKAMAEFRADYEDRVEKQRLVDDMYYRRKMSEQKGKFNSKLAEQRKAEQERRQKLYKELRERKDTEIALAKKHGREMVDKYKDNAERKTRIQSITANALSLNEMLVKNSKDKHIPEVMKGPVIKLLQAIDFTSKRQLEGGAPTQRDISLAEAFSDVKAMLADATNSVAGLEELYGHDLTESIELLTQAAFALVGDNSHTINAMSNEELYHLDKLVRHIKKVVTDLNKFHTIQRTKGVVELSEEFIGYGKKLKKLKTQHGTLGKFFVFRNRTPYYFFKELGQAGAKIFEAFQDGWDKLAFNAKKVIDFATELYKPKEVQQWSKEVHQFTIKQPDGIDRTIEMTTSQIMSLYCVAKQEDAVYHLINGGMTLKRIDKKGHVITDYDNISLSITDIQKITKSLTDRQREVADGLQRFMNTVCAEWGNEISMARFGIKMFGIENYFPIKVSAHTTPTDTKKDIDNASLFRLLNMSFTHARKNNAPQSIEIGDVFDVFAQHSSEMAKYNALALPVLDFAKWYSITGTDENNKEYGVVQTLQTVFGDEAVGYLKRFIRDLNGSQNVSRDVLGNTFFKNAKVASVAANLRVILLQPTAFVKASAMMDNKYLLKASAYVKVNPVTMLGKLKKATEQAEKYCGIALWKSLGYYDTDISKGLIEKIKHSEGVKNKLVEKSMKGAELADKATFSTLWIACEFEVRDTRKDLKVGSPEFYDAVGKRLRDVIYSTQVVDSTLTRSDMMRSSDKYDKMLTTFGSEPIVAYNMLLDLATQYNRDKQAYGKETARKKNTKQIRKVVTAYIAVHALSALVEAGFDWYRDDEDEMDVAVFVKLWLSNFLSNMSIGNKLPGIKELYSIVEGFSPSRMDTQGFEYVMNVINDVEKFTEGKGKPMKLTKDLLRAFSSLSGIPAYNVFRDAMALLDKLDIVGDD